MPVRLRPRRSLPHHAALLAALVAGACDAPPDDDVPPPIPPEVVMEVTEPGGTEGERARPISAADVGDLVMVTGFVVGNPGPEGFFVQTERGQVLLVRSPQPAAVGQAVRATGRVREAEVARFEGWQRELLGEMDPQGELLPILYLEATRVVSVAGP